MTVRGTGWIPRQTVANEVSVEGDIFGSATAVPDANGAFEAIARGEERSSIPGRTFTVESRDARNALKASTTAKCPGPPGPGPNPSPPGPGPGGGVIPPPVRDAFTGLLAGQLPETGGGWAVLLVAGGALVGSGWFVVRLARRLAAR